MGLLAHADRATTLPRLGGMARPDGVVIASERYWALARRDGVLVEGRTPRPASWTHKVPLVRGLVRLASAFGPVLGASGVAKPLERVVLTFAILAPIGLAFLAPRLQILCGLALTAALIAWLFRGRTLHLHGAEHRAIEAAERRELFATWDGEARPTRFNRRCGTNLGALATLMAAPVFLFVPWAQDALLSAPIAVATLALSMEAWAAVQASTSRAASWFLLPGLALQRLTTREPTLDETRLALRATMSVLRRELGYEAPSGRREIVRTPA